MTCPRGRKSKKKGIIHSLTESGPCFAAPMSSCVSFTPVRLPAFSKINCLKWPSGLLWASPDDPSGVRRSVITEAAFASTARTDNRLARMRGPQRFLVMISLLLVVSTPNVPRYSSWWHSSKLATFCYTSPNCRGSCASVPTPEAD